MVYLYEREKELAGTGSALQHEMGLHEVVYLADYFAFTKCKPMSKCHQERVKT